jgi:hypothetical protein
MPRPPPRRRSPGRAYPRRPVSTAKDRRAVCARLRNSGLFRRRPRHRASMSLMARSPGRGTLARTMSARPRTSTSAAAGSTRRSMTKRARGFDSSPPATRGLRSRAATDGTVVPASRPPRDRAAALPRRRRGPPRPRSNRPPSSSESIGWVDAHAAMRRAAEIALACSSGGRGAALAPPRGTPRTAQVRSSPCERRDPDQDNGLR